MIACLDVHYRDTSASACAAAVTFLGWTDADVIDAKVVQVQDVEPYEPGQFYRRELPCLLAVLQTLPPVDAVLIDGYVWLADESRPGLGAHLHQALGGKIPVIGAAKTKFHGAGQACEVLRGESRRPLYVTAAGMEVNLAAEHVRSMHGVYRIPTLVAWVDQLCRRRLDAPGPQEPVRPS